MQEQYGRSTNGSVRSGASRRLAVAAFAVLLTASTLGCNSVNQRKDACPYCNGTGRAQSPDLTPKPITTDDPTQHVDDAAHRTGSNSVSSINNTGASTLRAQIDEEDASLPTITSNDPSDLVATPYNTQAAPTTQDPPTSMKDDATVAEQAAANLDQAAQKAADSANQAAQKASDALDQAGQKAAEFADDAAQKTSDALDKAGQAAQDAVQKTEQAIDDAAQKAKDAVEPPVEQEHSSNLPSDVKEGSEQQQEEPQQDDKWNQNTTNDGHTVASNKQQGATVQFKNAARAKTEEATLTNISMQRSIPKSSAQVDVPVASLASRGYYSSMRPSAANSGANSASNGNSVDARLYSRPLSAETKARLAKERAAQAAAQASAQRGAQNAAPSQNSASSSANASGSGVVYSIDASIYGKPANRR